ncbi:HAMP domain-containing histidine kinase [Candidatus Woesebacteria bacterium]|nr:HAMP domain-containing histidine kinase [Candidatus Woesebacteria bacterium]
MSRVISLILHLPLALQILSIFGLRHSAQRANEVDVVLRGPFFQHALSNPLMLLSGYLEAGLHETIPQKIHMEQAYKACQYLLQLVTVFKGRSIIEDFEVVGATREVVQLHNTARRTLHLAPSVRATYCCEQDLKISGSKIHWQEVLHCLITNAIEAYSMSDKDKLVTVVVFQSNTALRVEIIDFAAGMNFTQKILTSVCGFSLKPNGNGLGLVFVRKTVEGHFKGQFSLDSKLGIGTVARVRLPIS